LGGIGVRVRHWSSSESEDGGWKGGGGLRYGRKGKTEKRGLRCVRETGNHMNWGRKHMIDAGL